MFDGQQRAGGSRRAHSKKYGTPGGFGNGVQTHHPAGGHPAVMTTSPDLLPIRGRTWLPFVIGFVPLWGTLALLGGYVTSGLWGVPIFVAVAIVALLVERVLFRTPLRAWISTLGLGRPGWRVIVLATVVSGLVLLVFPITTLVTGAQLEPVTDWPWILIGLFAYHGLSEEMVWRQYSFRRLRAGRPFPRAVLWTMPLIAAAHIPVIVSSGPIVGIGAMLVAAITAIPLGYLYETGRGTIWAPAILHTAIDSFKIFMMPAAAVMTFSLLLIAVSLIVPLLTLAVRRRVLVGQEQAK